MFEIKEELNKCVNWQSRLISVNCYEMLKSVQNLTTKEKDKFLTVSFFKHLSKTWTGTHVPN